MFEEELTKEEFRIRQKLVKDFEPCSIQSLFIRANFVLQILGCLLDNCII